MLLQLQIKNDSNLALKEGRRDDRIVLSTLYSSIVNKAVEKRLEVLSDEDTTAVILKFLKSLTDEIEAFQKANRPEKVEILTRQFNLIKDYLPKMLTVEEIKEKIVQLEDKSMKSIMTYFKTNFNGQVDMSLVSKVAKEIN